MTGELVHEHDLVYAGEGETHASPLSAVDVQYVMSRHPAVCRVTRTLFYSESATYFPDLRYLIGDMINVPIVVRHSPYFEGIHRNHAP